MPANLSLGGQLFAADGSTLARAGVNFRIQVLDASETCVLYTEDHLAEDLSQSLGHFNIILGSGTSKVNNVDGSGALTSAIFTNAGSTAVTGCASSPMTFAAGQNRQIHVLYDLGSGFVTMSPGVPVVSSAYAMVADSLNGVNASGFVQVNGTSALSQANEEYAFSLTNWPRLKALLDGTSSQYLSSTPTVPLDVNGQRITDVHDPTSAQDAATKHYVDTNLGGSALDLTAVGPMTGAGSTLLWDATANKWVAGTASTSPTGAAGGDLTGTYPNPTIANDKITSAKISSTGIAVNRLIITNATDGTTLGYGACTVAGQVYAWTTGGWACATVQSLSPVTSVAGKTGVVTLNAGDVSGLGTSALFDWGTAANQIVRMDGGARLPAVDGSLLTNVNAVQVQGRSVASTAPTAGQVLGWNAVSTRWEPTSIATSAGVSIATTNGILGGTITGSGTLSVDTGTAANKIVQENANAQIAQAAGLAATPAYSFAGNTGTGVFSPGANQMALSTSGTAALNVAANGMIGIGTANPGAALEVNGSALTGYATVLRLTSVGGDPGNGPFALVMGDDTQDTQKYRGFRMGITSTGDGFVYSYVANAYKNTLINPYGGNLGIGSSTPAAVVDINAEGANSAIIIPRDTAGNRPSGVNGMLRYNTTSNAFEGFANGSWGSLAAATTGSWTVNSPDIYFQGGQVGIGTAAMDHVLDVWGDASNRKLAGITDTTPSAQDVGGVLELKGLDGSSDRAFAAIKGGKQNGTSGNYDGYFAVFTRSFADNGNSEKMRITAQGLMGIATSTPTAALDVAATGSASAIVVPRDTTANRPIGVNGMIRYNTTTAGFEGFQGGVWTTINTAASGTTFPLLASPGTTSAATPSYSFNGNATTGIFSPAANQLAFATAGSTALTVTASGNVGVGTSVPGATLDVNGGIRPGSSSVVTTACGAATEGVQRYNYSSHALEICNGTNWLQVPLMTAGSTAPVVASGPPVSANVYSYTLSGNYTPGFGAFANLNKLNWVADGAAAFQNAGCVQLRAQAYSPLQVITIDLGSVRSIGHVFATMGGDNGLANLGITFSTDGTSYTNSTTLAPTSGDGTYVRYVTKTLSSTVTARYIQLMNITSNDYNNGAFATFCGFAIAP